MGLDYSLRGLLLYHYGRTWEHVGRHGIGEEAESSISRSTGNRKCSEVMGNIMSMEDLKAHLHNDILLPARS